MLALSTREDHFNLKEGGGGGGGSVKISTNWRHELQITQNIGTCGPSTIWVKDPPICY